MRVFVRLAAVLLLAGVGLVASPSAAHSQQPKQGQVRGPVIFGLAFSRDGSLVATCGDRVRVLDVESGKPLHEFDMPWTRAMAFSPTDRESLAAGSDDGTVRLWRVGRAEVVRELKGHEGNVLSLAFDPAGKRIVTGSTKHRDGRAVLGQLRLWDVAGDKPLHAIDLKDAGVTGVAFSSDGSLVAYCSGPHVHVQRVHGWERVTSIRLAAGKLEDGPHGKASPFGQSVLFVDGDRRLIVGGGICVPVSPEEAAPYKFACTTTGLLWGAALDDPESAKLLAEPALGYRFRLSLSPDGKRFATQVERTNRRGTPDPKIELRDTTDGKLVWRADADRGTPYGLAISPDGTLVASSVYDGIALWDAETGKHRRVIPLNHDR